jgi:hypothetical protein
MFARAAHYQFIESHTILISRQNFTADDLRAAVEQKFL